MTTLRIRPQHTVFHLGLPKTATTMLQRCVFAKHSGVEYFGKVFNGSVLPHPELGLQLSESLERADRPAPAPLVRALRSVADDAWRAGKTTVFSKEGLANGSPEKRRAQAMRMRELMGECKALVCLREPFSFLESIYFQQLKGFHKAEKAKLKLKQFVGGAPRYFTIDQWLGSLWGDRPRTLGTLQVADTADIYAEVFGRENVKVVIFEQLVADPKTFLDDLSDFVGIDAEETRHHAGGKRKNDRWKQGMIDRLKKSQYSPLFRMKFHFADTQKRWRMLGAEDPRVQATPKPKAPVPEHWRDRVLEFAGPQIQRLVDDWGLPLADYGYPTAGPAARRMAA